MVVRPYERPGDHEDQVPTVVPPTLHVQIAVMLGKAFPSTFWRLELVGTSGRDTRFQPGYKVMSWDV
jgi:hypothetical protein